MVNCFKNPKYFRDTSGRVYESYNGEPYTPSDTPVSRKDGESAEIEQAKTALRKLLKPNMTVYTVLNHRSASGMSRSITLCIGGKNGEIIKLDHLAITAGLGSFDNKNGGVKVGGCGMDMGFSLVYDLGRLLWPNGTKKPHGARNSDGGYALKQTWL
jgi:hypothetical protein